MATYRKVASGRWRVDVKRSGIRKSKTFKTKNDAMLWGIEQEKLLNDADGVYIPGYSLLDCFERYAREVSPKKAGERWEVVRLKKMGRDPLLGPVPAHDLKRDDVQNWIDNSLLNISPASVNRELNLLISVVKKAVDWKWIPAYPLTKIERPEKTPARRRRISNEEIANICESLGVNPDEIECYKRIHHVGVIFLFAIETACRLGEICGLTWDHVYLNKRYIHLPKTKNGDSRNVPLSTKAVHLLTAVKDNEGGGKVFAVSSGTASTLFARYCKKAGVTGLHFHDTRHEAVSRLAKIFTMMELAKIVGHRDPRSLMIYYEPSAEELAAKLD